MLFEIPPPKVVRGKTVKSWKPMTNPNEITQANDHYYHSRFENWNIISRNFIGLSVKGWIGDLKRYPAYRPIFKQRIG